MPKVPLLPQRQEATVTRLPRGGQARTDTAGMFEAQQRLGGTISDIGSDIADRAIQRQKEYNKIYATDAVSRYQQSMTDSFINAKATRGKASIGIHDRYRDEAIKAVDNFGKDLSPVASALYKSKAGALIKSWSGTLATHEAGQHQVLKKDSAIEDVKTAIADIVQNNPYDTEKISAERAKIVAENTELLGADEARKVGDIFDKEIKRQVGEATYNIVSARVETFLKVGDYEGAMNEVLSNDKFLIEKDSDDLKENIKFQKKTAEDNAEFILEDTQNKEQLGFLTELNKPVLPLDFATRVLQSSLDPTKGQGSMKSFLEAATKKGEKDNPYEKTVPEIEGQVVARMTSDPTFTETDLMEFHGKGLSTDTVLKLKSNLNDVYKGFWYKRADAFFKAQFGWTELEAFSDPTAAFRYKRAMDEVFNLVEDGVRGRDLYEQSLEAALPYFIEQWESRSIEEGEIEKLRGEFGVKPEEIRDVINDETGEITKWKKVNGEWKQIDGG
jgi:hypothetical protein